MASTTTPATITGTSTALERAYYRTAPTDPSEIRSPEAILKSLQFITEKAARIAEPTSTTTPATPPKRTPAEVRYDYIGGQLKGLRQDVVTQGIGGEVAAAVYQAHLDESRDACDAGEHSACMAALSSLADTGDLTQDAAAELLLQRLVYRSASPGSSSGLPCLGDLSGDVAAAVETLQAPPPQEGGGAATGWADAAAVRAALRFACAAAGGGSSHGVASAFHALPAPLRRTADSFGMSLRERLLEEELRACGPASIALSKLAALLFLPDAAAAGGLVAAVTGVEISSGATSVTGRPCLQGLQQKRANRVRRD